MTPSLREIFREIARTEGKLRLNPILDDWHAQGVFLMNVNLTTRAGASLATAHAQCGWHNVSSSILKHINSQDQKIAFVQWGAFAKAAMATSIPTKDSATRLFLKHSHPAARQQEFTGNNHFKLINEFLSEPVDWVGKDHSLVDK
jgi:uracil-DNA glycosylase